MEQTCKKIKAKHNHISETLGLQSFCLNPVCLGNYTACYLPIMFSFQLECCVDDLMVLMSSFLGGERREEMLLPNSDLCGWLSGECTLLIVFFLSCGCNCIYIWPVFCLRYVFRYRLVCPQWCIKVIIMKIVSSK